MEKTTTPITSAMALVSDKKPRQNRKKNVRTADNRASYTNKMKELIKEYIEDMLIQETKSTK